MKGKKLTYILSTVLAVALLACSGDFMSPSSLAAAADIPQSPVPHTPTVMTLETQSPSASPTQSQSEQSKTFTGKVTKSNGRFVLEDLTMNSTYYLDDSKDAQKYEGKNVKVTGTLDAANNTIHVQKIEAA